MRIGEYEDWGEFRAKRASALPTHPWESQCFQLFKGHAISQKPPLSCLLKSFTAKAFAAQQSSFLSQLTAPKQKVQNWNI